MTTAPTPDGFARVVVVLGIGQIISWGILIYSIAVLGEPMSRDLGVSSATVFGAFSAALFVSGIAMPRVGVLIDRIGGRRVLVIGATLAGFALLLMSVSRSTLMFVVAWLVIGVAMSMSLYETAFATLSQQLQSLRRAITAVTLFGGFASTVFIPLTLYASEQLGWRYTVAAFGAFELLCVLPMYAAGISRSRPSDWHPATVRPGAPTARSEAPRGLKVMALALAFAAAAFVTASIASHVVNLFSAKGLGVEAAVWIAALIGPMQVVGRIVEIGTERWIGITTMATVAFCLMVVAMAVLTALGSGVAFACLFVTMYGIANGIITIARGAVPAELFGRTAYGSTIGRIAAPSLVARALGPFVVALGLDGYRRFGATDLTLMGAAAIGLATFVVAVRIKK